MGNAGLFVNIGPGGAVKARIMSDMAPTSMGPGHRWLCVARQKGADYEDAREKMISRLRKRPSSIRSIEEDPSTVPDAGTTKFPRMFLGEVSPYGEITSRDKPQQQYAIPKTLIAHGGVFIWRIHAEHTFYDILADYKGRGFWVIHGQTGEDLTGPVRANWKSQEAVFASVQTVEAMIIARS